MTSDEELQAILDQRIIRPLVDRPRRPPRDPAWSMDDVELVARATMADRIPPLEIMHRLGPFPPEDYLTALGRRVMELHAGQNSGKQS